MPTSADAEEFVEYLIVFNLLLCLHGQAEKGPPGIAHCVSRCFLTGEHIDGFFYRDSEGEPVGVLELRRETPSSLEGHVYLYVHPLRLRQGIGRSLARHALSVGMDLDSLIRSPGNELTPAARQLWDSIRGDIGSAAQSTTVGGLGELRPHAFPWGCWVAAINIRCVK